MGTEITLDVGGLCVDWNKNSRGVDHGMLFQSHHRKRVKTSQLDYDYPELDAEVIASMERALCATLSEVCPRLELLGFTLEAVKNEYESSVVAWLDMQSRIREPDDLFETNILSFTEFCDFIKSYPLAQLNNSYNESGCFKITQGKFQNDPRVLRLPVHAHDIGVAYSESSYFGTLIGFLHPYSTLRVLAKCEQNFNVDVIWNYGPVVENGYASEDDFVPGARREQAFLIATEGSSDVHIIKHAFALLKPEIQDFFRFIDVSESHPFPGTGNLVKFADGLIKIDIQNNVIFVFDNDAEGYEAYQRIAKMSLLPNMRVMLLPELAAFNSFLTSGPNGESLADINRRAAAIECYLDLEHGEYPAAKVIWTTYKKEMEVYHGALEHKESYTRSFLKQTYDSVRNNKYDTSKLVAVLDALIEECFSIKSSEDE
ncbi:HEPN/Toprim-associated domain-containing protein [Pseudomonas protegens]|uniref:HEPN/Toprim-associated domain-containing protein n=1 Tax=Pseudomonas protegens TaxID=380021 RepID=UPI00320B3720